MKGKTKSILWVIVTFSIVFFVWLRLATFHPRAVQTENVHCGESPPLLKPGQKLKILNWNVQYMASKNYVFFYDLPNFSGPDVRPSPEHITQTFSEVARVIQDENPDLILLQELDDGAKRTDYEDQLTRLLEFLPRDYSCQASAFYWKASFVPHPRIWGKVGMKLVTLSKHKMISARRYQLPIMPENFLSQQFNFKRSILEVRLPIENATELVVLNTHLDAFAQGMDTMEKQVQQVRTLLAELTQKNFPWLIGGDFNLLPPGKAYSLLSEKQQWYFKEKTELELLITQYQSVPSLKEVDGLESSKWFTHFPNDPEVTGPDRTIDYLFFSPNLRIGDHWVRQKDTLKISDHLPVVAEFMLRKL